MTSTRSGKMDLKRPVGTRPRSLRSYKRRVCWLPLQWHHTRSSDRRHAKRIVIVALVCFGWLTVFTFTSAAQRRFFLPNHKAAAALYSVPFDVANNGTKQYSEHVVLEGASSFVVDIISIGSLMRSEQHRIQALTMGSHRSVRHFFQVTERDDFEQNCSIMLSDAQTRAVSSFCGRAKLPAIGMRLQRGKTRSPGWLCAQRRPMAGLKRALDAYRDHHIEEQLPDWLMIVDDDTYYNLESVNQYLMKHYSNDKKLPLAVAGCRMFNVRSHLGFYVGGMGVMMNQASVKRWMQPIHCYGGAANVKDYFASSVCRAVEANKIGERALFRNGMSVSDLLFRYVRQEPYNRVDRWTRGYCLHSDWTMGYFLNNYNLSQSSGHHDQTIAAFQDSEWISGDAASAKRTGYCASVPEDCTSGTDMCHHIFSEQMKQLFSAADK